METVPYKLNFIGNILVYLRDLPQSNHHTWWLCQPPSHNRTFSGGLLALEVVFWCMFSSKCPSSPGISHKSKHYLLQASHLSQIPSSFPPIVFWTWLAKGGKEKTLPYHTCGHSLYRFSGQEMPLQILLGTLEGKIWPTCIWWVCIIICRYYAKWMNSWVIIKLWTDVGWECIKLKFRLNVFYTHM